MSDQMLANALPEIIWTCSVDGQLEWVNARWTELTGLSNEESLDKRALRVVHPDDHDVIATSWQAALATSEPCRFEYRIRNREGLYRWHLAYVTPVKDGTGAVTGWVAAAVDIHERRLAEGRFETVFHFNPYPIVVVRERDGSILQVNDAFLTMSGFAREEVIDHDAVELGMIADRTHLGAAAADRPEGVELPFRTRLGTVITMALTVTRIDYGGEPCWLAVGKDVTQQRAAEAGLRSSEAALREADRRKDEFLALLSHELRNPLAPIIMATQVLGLSHDGSIANECAVIMRQAGHLLRLIDDLLDVSRVTRGKIRLVKRPVKVATPIRAALEATAGLFEQRRHRLIVDLEPGLAVDGDEVRLTQVFINLLTNAARYTPPEGRVELVAVREQDLAVVRVRDNGSGMDDGLLANVFELFVQGEREPDRAQGGLGVGLSLVRGLTELHGGTVGAASGGLGRGSELTVRIPALPPDTRVEPPPSAPPAPLLQQGRRVLVVDDNEDGAVTLARALELLGHSVRVAHGPGAALEIAPEFVPHIAILDIGLPEMDGYRLGRELVARISPPPALVALTGYGQKSDLERSQDAGFALHLVKPLDLERLRAALHDLTK